MTTHWDTQSTAEIWQAALGVDLDIDSQGVIPPWSTLGACLDSTFKVHAEHESVVDGEQRLTYRELHREVLSIAASLRATGLQHGDRVVLWSPNCWQMQASILACWWSGMVVVPLSYHLKPDEALPLMQRVQPGLIIAGAPNSENSQLGELFDVFGEHRDQAQSVLPGSSPIVDLSPKPTNGALSWAEFRVRAGTHRPPPCAAAGPEDLSYIVFTSGTTGQPKGVAIRQGQILRSLFNCGVTQAFRPGNRMLLSSPLSHTFGLCSQMLNPFMLGMCLVYPRSTAPQELASTIAQLRAAIVMGPPSLFESLLRANSPDMPIFDHVEHITIGGASIPRTLIHTLRECGVHFVGNGYGLSEFPVVSVANAHDSANDIAHTVGLPIPGIEIRIDLPSSEAGSEPAVGEILLRGYPLMAGYYNDTEATQSAIDSEGWLYTGDLGYLRNDGRLCIVGRCKDMFISHGINIYPADVEQLLMRNDQLEQVAVVGRSSRLAGEEGVAFCVPKNDAEFDPAALRRWCFEHITRYKIPVEFIELASLPLNANGKVDKVKLDKQLRSRDRL
ncbi:MAG: AMP-binding protein [Pseudomonadota bacterium]